MAKRIESIFDIPLHKVCSKDDIRPIMTKVHFTDKYAYATNGFMAVRMKMDDLPVCLNFASVPWYIYQELYQKNKRAYVPFIYTKCIIGIEKGVDWKYEPEETDLPSQKFVNSIDKLIKERLVKTRTKIIWDKSISINPKALLACQEVLGFDDKEGALICTFKSAKDSVLLTFKEYSVSERVAIIMPRIKT